MRINMETLQPASSKIEFEQQNPTPVVEFSYSNPFRQAETMMYAVMQGLRIDTFPVNDKFMVTLPTSADLTYTATGILKADNLEFRNFDQAQIMASGSVDGLTVMERFSFPVQPDIPRVDANYLTASYAGNRYGVVATAAELFVYYPDQSAYDKFRLLFPEAMPSQNKEATLNLDIWRDLFVVNCNEASINGVQIDPPLMIDLLLHFYLGNYVRTVKFDLQSGEKVLKDFVLEPALVVEQPRHNNRNYYE